MQFRIFDSTVRKVERKEGDAEDAPTLYEVSISSETEIERWFGVEVLDHSSASVDMSRLEAGAAVLVDHGGDQVGVVEEAGIKGSRLVGKLRFSRSTRGREVEQDVADGIRRNISVGYFVKDAEKVETRDGMDVWKVTRWQPAEVSIVSVPADYSIGVGRSQQAGEFPVNLKDGVAVEEGRSMRVESVKFNGGGAGGGGSTAPPATPEGDAREQRNDEVARICAANNLSAVDVESYQRGADWRDKSVAEVAIDVARKASKARGVPPSSEALGLGDIPADDLAGYSYHRAIRRTIEAMENPHNARFDGVEAAVHRHLESNWPSDLKRHGGFLAPMRTRTLSSTIGTKGPEVVQQTAGELIELLRSKSIVLQSGARLLTGLSGPVGFPRVTGGVTVAWVPENPSADTPSSDPSLGVALLSPHTMQGIVPFTRQLAMQSSFDLEGWVRDELAVGHSLAMDKAAIHGSGVSGQPTGIYNAQNVATKDFGSSFADLPGLMDMVTSVADNNADFGAMRWLASIILAGRLRVTTELGNTVASTIWKGNLRDGEMLGYGASGSTQASKAMTSNGASDTGGTFQALMFGNWSDLLFALFGAMEFVVDPFTKKARNIIEVATFQMGDVLPRHGQSFTKALNLPPQ
jgi:HK97 family phage major capsid protein